jgi:hypothetical protein
VRPTHRTNESSTPKKDFNIGKFYIKNFPTLNLEIARSPDTAMDPREMDRKKVDILLIDDSSIDAKIITHALQKGASIHLQHMKNGVEASTTFQEQGPMLAEALTGNRL